MVVKIYVSGISGNKEVKKKQQRVQMILDSKSISYEAIDITEPGKEKEKETMQQKAKVRENLGKHPLPPQIFNDDEYCGDYEDFDMANEIDQLEAFLHLPLPSKFSSDESPIGDQLNGSRELIEDVQNGDQRTDQKINGDVELVPLSADGEILATSPTSLDEREGNDEEETAEEGDTLAESDVIDHLETTEAPDEAPNEPQADETERLEHRQEENNEEVIHPTVETPLAEVTIEDTVSEKAIESGVESLETLENLQDTQNILRTSNITVPASFEEVQNVEISVEKDSLVADKTFSTRENLSHFLPEGNAIIVDSTDTSIDSKFFGNQEQSSVNKVSSGKREYPDDIPVEPLRVEINQELLLTGEKSFIDSIPADLPFLQPSTEQSQKAVPALIDESNRLLSEEEKNLALIEKIDINQKLPIEKSSKETPREIVRVCEDISLKAADSLEIQVPMQSEDPDEELDQIRPLVRRDTLKHIKRPSLPLVKPGADLEKPKEMPSRVGGLTIKTKDGENTGDFVSPQPEGLPTREIMFDTYQPYNVDTISFSPQLVAVRSSPEPPRTENRGVKLRNWDRRPSEIDLVKEVRSLLDERDSDLAICRARARAGLSQLRNPHKIFISKMNNLISEIERKEELVDYQVVRPRPPPPKKPSPPPPPRNEFLEEVLRVLNEPKPDKPKPAAEAENVLLKQVKELVKTEQISDDGRTIFFCKEKGVVDESEFAEKVRLILDERESSLGIVPGPKTPDHSEFLGDVLSLLNDEPIVMDQENAVDKFEFLLTPPAAPENIRNNEEIELDEPKSKNVQVAKIFIQDSVFPITARVKPFLGSEIFRAKPFHLQDAVEAEVAEVANED